MIGEELGKKVIQISELSFKWEDEEFIFDNVSLTIEKPKVIALRGENGSGKTTLLKLLSGMIPHFSRGKFIKGDIKLFGKSIFSFPPKEFFPQLAFLPDSNEELFFFTERLIEEIEILQGLLNLDSGVIQTRNEVFTSFFPHFRKLQNLSFKKMNLMQRQQCLLFIYFLQNADIFFLDEMQWQMQSSTIQFFKALKKLEKTVIFVNQYKHVEGIDEVWTISNGKIYFKQ